MSKFARTIPTMDEVRSLLWCINQPGIRELSEKSGVPTQTILKIRHKQTLAPSWETVRALLPHVDTVLAVKAHHSRQYRKALEAVSAEKTCAGP